MKILIFYLSIHHQNTKRVIDYLKRKYSIKAINLSKTSFLKAKNKLKNYPIIGFASGIYFSKHHQLLFKFLKQLPKVSNKKAFILSTAGLPFLKFLWHLPLRKKLKEKGFKIIGEFSLPGYDTFGILKFIGGINKGRPNKEDLKLSLKYLTSKIVKKEF